MDDQFIIHLLFHPEYIPYEVRPLIPGTHHLPITNPDRLLEFASEDHKMTAATAPPGVKVSIMNPDRLLEFPRKDHKMTDATVPDVDEPIPEPFRLLDLPREVRDEIYHAMLCDWPKGPVSQHILVLGMLQVTPLFRRITPRILLANKQTYQEAKLVLLKGNQFIHVNLVVNDSSIIPSIFIPSTMPVVASGRNRVALFRHLVVMKYDINWPRAPRLEYQHGQIEAIMLYRDLEQLCKSIDRVDQSTRRFSIQPQQRITMYNPFKLTMSPLFLNRKIQGRLLKPVHKILRGFDRFLVSGHLDADLAMAVTAKVRKEPELPQPQVFLEELFHQTGLGNQALSAGDPERAIGCWKTARITILRAANRRAWPRLKTDGGKDFTDGVSQLAFQIENNDAQGYLVMMQKVDKTSPGGHDMLKALGQNVTEACDRAGRSAALLGTGWTPSDEQKARIVYCRAQAHRIAEHYWDAQQSISIAARLLPGDPLIESEAQEIAGLRERLPRRRRRGV